jgi:hypothetical protein
MKIDVRAVSSKLLKNKTSLFCFVAIIVAQAMFAQTANILVTPANTTATVGQSFTVNVRVDLQTGSCNGAEVHLNFDEDYLQITNITKPSFGTFSSETIPLPAAPYTTANSTGHLEYAAGMTSGNTSADFNILAITFTPTQAGNTNLIFQNIAFHRTRVALNGIPLTSTLSSGSVSIQNCTPPTATIGGSSASSTCNAQPVSLKLESASGVSPYTLVVDGNTYNNVTVGSTFTSTPIPFPTHKIWPSTDPGVSRQNDGGGLAIEVGNKFRSTTAGFVKGLRFYRGSGTGYTLGTYKGKLWNFQTGALLASITYSGVTTGASGQWYEAIFSTPVAIAANTTYLVTIYNSAGNYVATDNFFTSGVTSGPLTALANSTSTNGLYFFGSEQSGPSTNFGTWQSYLSTNYWTDVIFAQNTNSFHLESITDATGCTNSGALQTLNVTSVDCSTLPVTLTNLSASPNGRKVTLRWSTSSESNNKGFDVERSNDGSTWTTIGFVAGVGNSVSTSNYTYIDDNLETRRYYYRLRQMDIDDRSKYSMIVSAVIGNKGEYVLGQNYPNPFRNQTTIQYTLPQAGRVNLTLFDISGRTVKVLVNGTKEAGTHAVNVNTGSLTRGIYYYRMQVGDFTDVKKLTIQ